MLGLSHPAKLLQGGKRHQQRYWDTGEIDTGKDSQGWCRSEHIAERRDWVGTAGQQAEPR